MNIGLDFSKIRTNEFYSYLKKRDLMKSHLILKEDLNEYRDFFISQGLTTLNELYDVIKTKSRVIKYAKTHFLDEEYLIILRRHIMSFIVKPRNMDDFKMLDPVDIYILQAENIKTTSDLHSRSDVIERMQNQEYINSVLEFTSMRYVSASFAEAIYFAGYKTKQDIADTTAKEFKDKINEAAKKYQLFKSVFGESDSQYLIDDAKLFLKWM